MLYLLLEQLRDWLIRNDLFFALRILDQIEFRALAAIGVAFALVILLGPRTIATLRRLKIGDSGLTDADLLKRAAQAKANVPTMGGVLIVGAILLASALLADVSQFYVSAGLLFVLLLAALGSADDWLKLTSARRGTGGRQGLYAWEKLVFQLGFAALVGWFLFRQAAADPSGMNMGLVLNLPFQKTWISPTQPNPNLFFLPSWAFVLLCVLVMAGLSNAVNITDGMDGLAGGISAAVAAGLMVLCLIAGDPSAARLLLVPHIAGSGELAVVAGAMLGAALGFLWYNANPAQVFMGDTGSLALGALIGYIACVIRQEHVVLIMGAVFLAEIASVILQVAYFKATGGKRVFRCAPYHHHLHLGGWTESQVVARAWIVSILLVVLALASIKVR